MADTVVSTFEAVRYNENLRNRGQVDHKIFTLSDYSATDLAVGAGDTLAFKLLKVPADVVITDVMVKVHTANGATLVAEITDGTNVLHADTFNLNSATLQWKTAANNVITTASDIYLKFGNSADVNCTVLKVEVGISFIYGSISGDNA